MRFFVAKVNLASRARLGFSYLRPLQVAYESPKFMLPIRLGMVNAKGPQELFVYALTRNGRVETTNYRTVKLPSDMDLPVYLKQPSEFGELLQGDVRAAGRERRTAAPCSSNTHGTWAGAIRARPIRCRTTNCASSACSGSDGGDSRPPNVFLTRLHVRYDNAHFPEDLVFQETADRANFQGRYVLRHAWTGDDSLQRGAEYRQALPERREREAEQLAPLTGWSIADIRKKTGPERRLAPSRRGGNGSGRNDKARVDGQAGWT